MPLWVHAKIQAYVDTYTHTYKGRHIRVLVVVTEVVVVVVVEVLDAQGSDIGNSDTNDENPKAMSTRCSLVGE